jgi:hypothetical protein
MDFGGGGGGKQQTQNKEKYQRPVNRGLKAVISAMLRVTWEIKSGTFFNFMAAQISLQPASQP